MNRAILFTLFFSLLLAIGVAEVALRIANISYPEFNRLDSRLGWTPRPGVEGIYAFEGRTYLRINSQGFRDVDHEVAKPEGVLRVAVLGDSFTEAREVPLPDTYWKVMEREFSACLAASGRRAEVLGFAVNGYGTAQQLMVLEDSVWRYEPDLVVLAFFTGND
ncbi:MAG: G-D-S-L family lipolytic protein, partial [Rhodospirillaceae bacterium]|nr:G-D-S-L family lipolytic protein [Rhodospirillaceae bacterium]